MNYEEKSVRKYIPLLLQTHTHKYVCVCVYVRYSNIDFKKAKDIRVKTHRKAIKTLG